MNKSQIAIIALIGFSIVLIQFIIIDKWNQENEIKSDEIFNQGFETGAVDTIADILTNTNECKVAKIIFENFTREVVDIVCLENVTLP